MEKSEVWWYSIKKSEIEWKYWEVGDMAGKNGELWDELGTYWVDIRVHTGPGNREKVGDFEQAFSRPWIAWKLSILGDWSGNRREFWIQITAWQLGGVYHVCQTHVRSLWRHRRWAEHRAKHDNVYLLSAVPLTNIDQLFSFRRYCA